nr:MAG TPA: hypothetical protein [Caudoviricetes sp.]
MDEPSTPIFVLFVCLNNAYCMVLFANNRNKENPAIHF